MSIIPNNPFSSAIATSFPYLSVGNPDWKETPEAHVFTANILGLKLEEVKVEVEDGRVLQIRGERRLEKENKNDGSHRVERCGGKFMRSFTLPANAKLDEVKASMENGFSL